MSNKNLAASRQWLIERRGAFGSRAAECIDALLAATEPKTVQIVAITDPEYGDDGYETTGVYVNGVRIASGSSGRVEPEDASFSRSYAWVISAFEGLAGELGATVEYHDIEGDDAPDTWPAKDEANGDVVGNHDTTD